MRRPGAFIAGALCVALATGARAEEDLTKHPGYIDFGALDIFGKEDTTVEIFLDEKILKNIDARLKQIRVQSFDIQPAKREDLESKTAEISKQLEAQGWSAMIKVHDRKKDSQTYVYIKWTGNKSQGLAVMNVEPYEQATFVNIVGEMDPDQLRKLSTKLDIDALDSLDLDSKHHGETDRRR
jgi:hypothetical protein